MEVRTPATAGAQPNPLSLLLDTERQRNLFLARLLGSLPPPIQTTNQQKLKATSV